MSKETGGPAFPVDADGRNYHPGQTLRDYFAGKALQGILSSGANLNMGPSHTEEMEDVAKTIYLMADAMLKVRGK